jgi:hypothetical protein
VRAAKLLERRQQTLLLADPEVRELGRKLAETRRALAAALLAPAGQTQRARELTEQKENLERQLAARLPAFGELQARDRLGPGDLVARLPAGAVFVDLLRYTRIGQDSKVPGKKGMQHTRCYVAYVLRAGPRALGCLAWSRPRARPPSVRDRRRRHLVGRPGIPSVGLAAQTNVQSFVDALAD